MLNSRSSGLRPFEFRLTREEKERLRQLSANAGVSMSEYVRRSIDSCYRNMQFQKWLRKSTASTTSPLNVPS
jgi:hypothetical protein